MKSMNCALGALLIVLLFATSFAAGATGTAMKESQVMIQQDPNDGYTLNIGVLAFDRATTTSGKTAGELAKEFEAQCTTECQSLTGDCKSGIKSVCMQQKVAHATATSDCP